MMIRSWGLVVVFSSVPLAAHAEGFALAAKAGSVGIGAEATVRLTPKLNLRLGGGLFKYHYQGVLSDVDYSLDLDLKGGAAALDFHPGGGPFRASLGLLLHGNRLDGSAVPSEPVTIGDHRYLPSQVGTLSMSATYKRHAAPFATLGVGNGARGGRLFLSFEGGVVFTRSPAVTLGATGSTAGLDDDLRIEEQKVNDDLGVLKLYPILSVGVGIRL